jgi:hypothetical protein
VSPAWLFAGRFFKPVQGSYPLLFGFCKQSGPQLFQLLLFVVANQAG